MHSEHTPSEILIADPPAAPFRLLHIVRASEHDWMDKLAFDVFVELGGLFEMSAPVLYYLTPHPARCGFALADYAPRTHQNQLMMVFVDQDHLYEDLEAFEARVRSRARRLLAPVVPTPAPLADEPEMLLPGTNIDPGEPPAWTYEPLSGPLDEAIPLADYDFMPE